MNWKDQLRSTIISTIVRDTPKDFWEDLRSFGRQTYLDAFHQVRMDPNMVNEQRIDKLLQDRHFRMEELLARLSRRHGLACTSTLLIENNRYFVYAAKGAIGLTQAYVPSIGSMPKPARFRERLAQQMNIPKEPRFEFGDEPREVTLGKDFYGIIAHNPVGRRFDDEHQRLGMMQICIPVHDCSDWAAEITIQEVVSAYEPAENRGRADRRLAWKDRNNKKGQEK